MPRFLSKLPRVEGAVSSVVLNVASKLVLTGILLIVLVTQGVVLAKTPMGTDGIATMAATELPKQGQETYERIRQGGPFDYDKDGVVFGNRERQLPAQKRGYYREYTVKTPGAKNRGARRIVCGGQPKTPDACYYTADHYDSFRRITP